MKSRVLWLFSGIVVVAWVLLGIFGIVNVEIFKVVLPFTFLPFGLMAIPLLVKEVLKHSKSLKIPGAEFVAHDQIVSKVDDIGEAVELLASKLASVEEQGTVFQKHNSAFNDAFQKIESILKHDPSAAIQLRLLVVSMRYSLEYLERSIELAKSFPDATIEWKICMTSPDYLAKLGIHKDPKCDWEGLGRQAMRKLEETREKIASKDISGSFAVNYKTYNAIPQWHGLLVVHQGQARHLYLGTSDWDVEHNDPILSVGSNQYRYFTHDSKAGLRHIAQFRHWFTIYRRWGDIAGE